MNVILVHLAGSAHPERRRPGAAATSSEAPVRLELGAPLSAGGSHADGLHLPGCPPAAVRLLPCAAGVVVEAVAAGVRAAGHPLHPGGRRLLRAGERAELHGATLEVAGAAPREETRAAAAELLRAAAAGEAPPAGLHLVVLSGPAAGTRHPLDADQTIGRGRRATIVLPDPAASRVHARVRVGPDGARVEDLRSKNGVRVNGVRIDPRPFPVRPGDELAVGDTALALADGVPDLPADAAAPRPRRSSRGPHVVAALLAVSAAALALAAW
jgi:hypothetical protein